MAPPLVQMYQGGGVLVQNRVQTAVDRPKPIGITGLITCCECRYARQSVTNYNNSPPNGPAMGYIARAYVRAYSSF